MLLSLKRERELYHYNSLKQNTKQTKRNTSYMSPFLTIQNEMLFGNCSEWSTGKAYIPCSTVTIHCHYDQMMHTVMQNSGQY